jgi:ABC-2 type transport system ATP-binding protein
MTAVIGTRDLRRGHAGKFEAVKGISFRPGRGELFALLGTDGAGRTSTVELLEGLARPSGGTVRVLGHDPYSERDAVRPRVGVMLQEGGLPPELTVAETVRMCAGSTSGARPVAEAPDLVGLQVGCGVGRGTRGAGRASASLEEAFLDIAARNADTDAGIGMVGV